MSPFIIGILTGYALAAILTAIGFSTGNKALQIVNFASFAALTEGGVGLHTFFSVPDFSFLSASKGLAEIDAGYVSTVFAAYVPVAFVVFAEHIADHENISSVIGRDLLRDPGLDHTLLGDGIGSIVGAFFGGCPNTTYGESIACVAITRNASVATIVGAAVECMIIAFISPFVAFISSIPGCVMGGVCMALYGFIAVSGLKMIQKVNLDENRNLYVVSTILISGIGGLTLTFGKVTITAVACALILGIIVNRLLSHEKKEPADNQQ
jgi:uracil permease